MILPISVLVRHYWSLLVLPSREPLALLPREVGGHKCALRNCVNSSHCLEVVPPSALKVPVDWSVRPDTPIEGVDHHEESPFLDTSGAIEVASAPDNSHCPGPTQAALMHPFLSDHSLLFHKRTTIILPLTDNLGIRLLQANATTFCLVTFALSCILWQLIGSHNVNGCSTMR